MKHLVLLLFASFAWLGCSRSVKEVRLGIDRGWYPQNFGAQTPYVNGFVADLLIEIAKSENLAFQKIATGSDSLLAGLNKEYFDAVLTTLPPYTFNQAKYDFSQNFLELGPVLIIPTKGVYSKLEEFEYEAVGVIEGDPSNQVLRAYPKVIIKPFSNPVDLLDALADQEIAGALLDRLPAINYITDLYQGTLKVATKPLTDGGLRLVVKKGAHSELLHSFDEGVAHLKEGESLEGLLKKWDLSEP